jgi:type I restriction enzyme S subunit
MTEWEQVTLGDLIELQSGGTPSKHRPEYWNGCLPWVSPKDVKVDRLHSTEETVTEAAVGNGTKAVEPGTLLLVVRSMILARDVPLTVVQRRMCFNQDIKAVVPKPGVDKQFLIAWFLANRPSILGIVDEAGHGTKRIQTDRLLALPVTLLPVTERERVGSIIAAYNDLIEVNRRRISLLEEMARRLFEEWFVRFRFPGHKAVSGRVPIKPSKTLPVPKGWRLGTAGELIDFDPSTQLPGGTKPFIAMGSLSTSTSLIGEIEWREGKSGAKFKNSDTLFARITPCLENGKTGLVRNLPGEGAGFGSTEFIVMRGRSVGPAFCYFLARHDVFREHARRSMSGASGRQRVRTESLRTFRLSIPPTPLLKQFEATAWPLLELSGHLGTTNTRLRASRDLLLPRLVSGELSVSAADRELEPAA